MTPRLDLRCADCGIRHRAVCARRDETELARLEEVKFYRTYEAGQKIVWAGDDLSFVASVVSGIATMAQTLEDGRVQMVGLLLKEGTDANARTADGWTPMSLAASHIRPARSDETKDDNARFMTVIKYLHAHGVPLDLFASIALDKVDRLARLLKNDPALVGRLRPGGPALHFATDLDRKSAVALLLERGADANIRDSYSSTTLHVAAFWGREAIAKLLIDHNADVNATTKSGMTPLHESARLGTPRVAKLLLAAGAKAAATDDKGRTPLDWAKDSMQRRYAKPGHAEIVTLLQDYDGG